MIALWIVYASAIGAVLWGAAAALERVIRQSEGSARGVWVAALVGSVSLPVALLLRKGQGGPLEANGMGEGAAAFPGPLTPAMLPSADALRWVDAAAGGIWLIASLVTAAVFIRAALALRAMEAEWRSGTLAGAPVLFSKGMGPAVVGLRSPRIVVPEWVIELDESAQRLLVRHEREHIRAGDHRLLGIAALASVLYPWNPAIWCQLRRLREAVELDCDVRVVRSAFDRPRYGDLLLTVAERMLERPGSRLGLAVASPPLERRIRRLAGKPGGRDSLKMAAAAGLTIVLVAAVPLIPAPDVDVSGLLPDLGSGAGASPAAIGSISVPPVLLNGAEIATILEQVHPGRVGSAAVGGTVTVAAFVGAGGRIEKTAIQASSGDAAVDAAAEAAVRHFRFRPGRVDGRVAGMWTPQSVTFRPTEAEPAADLAEGEEKAPVTRLAIWTSPPVLAPS